MPGWVKHMGRVGQDIGQHDKRKKSASKRSDLLATDIPEWSKYSINTNMSSVVMRGRDNPMKTRKAENSSNMHL